MELRFRRPFSLSIWGATGIVRNVKHAELRSAVHNVADSLASGIGLMIGVYELDVFGEARRSTEGAITTDFLLGHVTEGQPSPGLSHAVVLYSDAFIEACLKAGWSIDQIREAKARLWSDSLQRRFTVTVEDASGQRSSAEYAGLPGKRLEILDSLGRIRPKPLSA